MNGRILAAAIGLTLACSAKSDTVSPGPFADGAVAIVDDVGATRWPRDSVILTSVTVTGDTLRLSARFGGGCARHRFALLLGRAFMESHPVQVHARLSHDGGGDMCDALLSRDLAFDLTPLKQRYATSYGPGAATIVIHLVGHARSARYSFD